MCVLKPLRVCFEDMIEEVVERKETLQNKFMRNRVLQRIYTNTAYSVPL